MKNIRTEVALSEKVTLRIGGCARYYLEPKNQREIIDAVVWAKTEKVPVLVLGKGSNVVVSDSGWPGVVINVSASFNAFIFNGKTAVCEGGMLLHVLVRKCVDKGLGGIERLAGIPGTVGGAVVMNAGAFGQNIADVLESVTWCDMRDGSVATCNAAELDMRYRSSRLHSTPSIVLTATFGFIPGDTTILENVYRETLEKRRLKQPLDMPNCGSVFKNPPGMSAGRLIEQCGLKGFRIGDIAVSEKHANFFVNYGHAAADDFSRLVSHVRKSVRERFDVVLEPEVIFVGEFTEPLFERRRQEEIDG